DVEAEGHQQRDKLVGARADGDTAEGAKRGRTFAGSEGRSLPKEVCAGCVGYVVRCGGRKLGRTDAFLWQRVADQIGEAFVERDDLIGRARERTKPQNIGVVTWEQDPIPLSARNYRARVHFSCEPRNLRWRQPGDNAPLGESCTEIP